MGGHALKSVKTRRYSDSEFVEVESFVLNRISDTFPWLAVSGIPAYSEKKSFGDLDVLIAFDDNMDYMDVVNIFKPDEVFRNGKVISFNYVDFQVDLIITDKSFFDFSRNYYSYNDLGNLMGRVAHRLGLKYGHEGLYYTARDGNRIVGDVLLTRDSRKAMTALGYDYDRFLEGFDSLDDIFRYTASTHFFNHNIFLLENRNHRSRVRDAKRPTYNAFLKYCSETVFHDEYDFSMDKSIYHSLIDKSFPGFIAKLKCINAKRERLQQFRARFNGSIIMNLTGLQGRELGAFMSKHKDDKFMDWVLCKETTDTDIECLIRNNVAQSDMCLDMD